MAVRGSDGEWVETPVVIPEAPPPAPRPGCSICARPDVEAINQALAKKMGLMTVIRLVDLTIPKSTLHNHRTFCLGLVFASTHTAREISNGTYGTTVPLEARTEPVRYESDRFRVAGQNPLDDAMTAPRKLVSAAVELECVKLRLRGKTYDFIAEKLGIDEDTAMDAVERVLLRTRKAADSKAPGARALDVQRCESVIDSLHDRAMGLAGAEEDPTAQDRALDRMHKFMERRAKLLGLDLPPVPEASTERPKPTEVIIRYAAEIQPPEAPVDDE